VVPGRRLCEIQPAASAHRRLRFPVQRLVLEHEVDDRLAAAPYRIIYELLEEERLVRVIAIGHRRDI
jgi:mRNA-degrading endonuclease RelE of RelBE toxin-antitoxin system